MIPMQQNREELTKLRDITKKLHRKFVRSLPFQSYIALNTEEFVTTNKYTVKPKNYCIYICNYTIYYINYDALYFAYFYRMILTNEKSMNIFLAAHTLKESIFFC